MSAILPLLFSRFNNYEVNANKSSPAPRAPSDLKRQGHVLLPNQVASPSCIALYSHRISRRIRHVNQEKQRIAAKDGKQNDEGALSFV